jgi:hypothetical protein
MKGKKKGGARERRGGKRWERRKWKGLHNTEEDCDDAASAYGTRMIATATDSEPTCMRSTKHKLASGDLAKKLLLQQRKQQSALREGKCLGTPGGSPVQIPCTVCNGATTTKPQPVVTRHHLPPSAPSVRAPTNQPVTTFPQRVTTNNNPTGYSRWPTPSQGLAV